MKLNTLIIGLSLSLVGTALPSYAGDARSGEPYVPDAGTPGAYSNARILDKLTPAARHTVEKLAGNDQIRSIKVDSNSTPAVFRIQFEKQTGAQARPELVVDAYGKVIKDRDMNGAATVPPVDSSLSNR